MIDTGLVYGIAKLALSTGGYYSDVVCQRRTITQVRFEDGKVDDISCGFDCGAGVRVILGDLASLAHTDVLDEEHLESAARAAAKSLEHSTRGLELELKKTGREPCQPVCGKTSSDYDIGRVVEQLKACDQAARGLGDEIKQVTVTHYGVIDEEIVVDSTGESRTSSCQRTRLVVQVVASKNGIIQTGQEAPGSLSGPEFYQEIDPPRIAGTAARRALTMLDARPSPTGPMAVVVNGGTGGVLLHEACGHGLEIDHVQKGASVYRDRLGDKVASEVVSASDNPTIPGLWGSYRFDDEGTPSQDTLLIDRGILRSFLYGRHEAMKEGRESTGNGRRQSFRYLPVPRMSNTYILPGSDKPQDIIASTASGLYAKKMGGGQVDPVTGDFVFGVSEGYLISNGKITEPVRGATLIGNGPRILEIIDAVGDDLSFEEGTCGKEGQGVPVTTGCPTFRITELTVGGTEVQGGA